MGNVSVGTPNSQAGLNAFNQSMVTPTQPKSLSVVAYKDNPNGTTTNKLSDGTFETVSYTKNADGSLTPKEIPNSQNITTFGTQPITLPQQNIPQVSPVVNQGEKIIQQTAIPESDLAKQRNSFSQVMLDVIPQLQGKTQEKYNTVQAATSGIQQRINDLSGQVFQKNAEIQKDDIQLVADLDKLEGGGILKSIVADQKYGIANKAQISRSLKMADANMLNAQVLALNGQLDFAKQTAEDAVNAKYSIFEDILNTKKAQLEVINPLLTAEEKKQEREQTIKTNLLLKEIETQKANETEARKMLVQGIAQGMPADLQAKAQDLINKGATSDQVASVMGIYAGDVLDRQIKQAQLAKLGIDLAKGRKELSTAVTSLSPEDTAKFNSTPQVKNTLNAVTYAKAVKEYRDAINKYGTGEVFGTGKGTLGAAYSALVGATKDYYQLGSLDNGVQRLIELGIAEPSIYNMSSTQLGALNQALKQAKDTMKTNVNQLAKGAYAGTQELNTIADDVALLEMETQSLQELMDQIPSQGNSGQDNAAFFGSTNTSTPAMVK